MLGELFGAESKQQVYGHLHSFLFDDTTSTSTLSKHFHDVMHMIQVHVLMVILTKEQYAMMTVAT